MPCAGFDPGDYGGLASPHRRLETFFMCMTPRSVLSLRTLCRAQAPGGFAALVVTAGVLLGAPPALADKHKASVSRDLEAVLHGAAAAPAGGIDVIVAGNPAFIARLATRHRVSVKKALKFGAVLTLTHAQLVT